VIVLPAVIAASDATTFDFSDVQEYAPVGASSLDDSNDSVEAAIHRQFLAHNLHWKRPPAFQFIGDKHRVPVSTQQPARQRGRTGMFEVHVVAGFHIYS
jgi:hypothetical protein